MINKRKNIKNRVKKMKRRMKKKILQKTRIRNILLLDLNQLLHPKNNNSILRRKKLR